MKRVAKRKHSAGLGRRAQRGRPHQGCAAPRTSTPRSGSAVRSLRRAAGQAASRVRSTEDEHAAQRQRSPKPATCSGAGRIKGCEAPRVEDTAQRYRKPEARNSPAGGGAGRIKGAQHRGRARRTAAAQSEARNSPAGGGAGRIKGCEAPRTSTPRSGSAVRSLRRAAGQAAMIIT